MYTYIKDMIIFSLIITLWGCNKTNLLENHFPSIRVNKIDYGKKMENIDLKNGNDVYFIIVNNPYKIDDNYKMVVYLNNNIVYSGKYTKFGKIKIPFEIKDGSLVRFKIELLTNNKKYIIQNKSNFNWDKNFEYIYTCFFPDNTFPDQVYFFPQKNSVIQ